MYLLSLTELGFAANLIVCSPDRSIGCHLLHVTQESNEVEKCIYKVDLQLKYIFGSIKQKEAHIQRRKKIKNKQKCTQARKNNVFREEIGKKIEMTLQA